MKEEETADIRKTLEVVNMNLIRKFLKDGQEHGTVVEALYEAFRAIETGEAHDIPGALFIGASEWYK